MLECVCIYAVCSVYVFKGVFRVGMYSACAIIKING